MEIFMCLINITIKFRNGQKKESYGPVAGGNGEVQPISNPQGFMLMQLEIYL
jgi:hypothetical protein